jgi:hypothetical protein
MKDITLESFLHRIDRTYIPVTQPTGAIALSYPLPFGTSIPRESPPAPLKRGKPDPEVALFKGFRGIF